MKLPIKIYKPTFSTTASGGLSVSGETLLTDDWALVSFGGGARFSNSYSEGKKYNNDQGQGQEDKAAFMIDYRTSLATELTQKCEIELWGVRYTITSIVNQNNRFLKYIIEGIAKH